MLKPIHYVSCSPALAACQRLMQRFSLWLCEANVHAADITPDNLKAQMPSQIEAEWLWKFLNRKTEGGTLLQRSCDIANLNNPEKQGLANWINAVTNLAQHFEPTPPPALPFRYPNGWTSRNTSWTTFKNLLVAFYEAGFREGLPYRADGLPTDIAIEQVTYEKFVAEFRSTHKLDPHPNSREICVLCGGKLGKPEVDHWLHKANFPLLSVCDNNLLPICADCNSGKDAKGQKPAHNNGDFTDWFHPYLRHTDGALRLNYVLPDFAVKCTSASPTDQTKVDNLDKLLNLTHRWTLEFKAEYRKKQKELSDLKRRGRGPDDLAALQAWLTDYSDSLLDNEPDYEVHKVLSDAMLEPTRLAAWHSELQSLS